MVAVLSEAKQKSYSQNKYNRPINIYGGGFMLILGFLVWVMVVMMKKLIMCRIRFLTLLIFHDITIFNHWGFQEGIIGKKSVIFISMLISCLSLMLSFTIIYNYFAEKSAIKFWELPSVNLIKTTNKIWMKNNFSQHENL